MLKKMSLSDLSKESRANWQTFILPSINESSLRFRVMDDTSTPWHTHDESDQMFFVVEGDLSVETDEECYELQSNEFVVVPAGLNHRTRAHGRVTLVIIDCLSQEQVDLLRPEQ